MVNARLGLLLLCVFLTKPSKSSDINDVIDRVEKFDAKFDTKLKMIEKNIKEASATATECKTELYEEFPHLKNKVKVTPKPKEPPTTLLDEWNKNLDFCKRNALYIFTAIGFYFTFYFIKHKIVQASNYLSQPTLWSSWRNDLSFNSLVSVPKETLTQWIVEDIQDHYQDDHSIKSFYKDAQAEQTQLQEIKNLYEKLDFFYMVDDQALVDVKTRLKILGLLKDLILMWELEQALAAQTALNSSSAPQT